MYIYIYICTLFFCDFLYFLKSVIIILIPYCFLCQYAACPKQAQENPLVQHQSEAKGLQEPANAVC